MRLFKYLARYGFSDWNWLYGYGLDEEDLE